MQLHCPQIPSEACLLQKRWWRKQFASSELKESSSQHHYFSKSLTKTSMSMLIFANSFKSTAIPFSIFFLSLSSILDLSIFSFFFCHRSWVSGLSFPPPLLLLPSWPLIFGFLLSILTQDKCSLLRRFLLLKELTAHIVGHWHCFFLRTSNPRAFSLLTPSMRKWQMSIFDRSLSQNLQWLLPF